MKRLFLLTALFLLLTATLPAQAVELTWDPNPPEEVVTQYHVHRSLNTGDFDLTLPLATVTQTTYVDRDGQAWTRYFYVVTAENAFGISKPSDEVTVTYPGVPSVPGGLRGEQAATTITSLRESLRDWVALQSFPKRDQVRAERALKLLEQAQDLVEILPGIQ